ncbi:hypothetical protein [Jiulongibacter sp. NS-SX5]|uniref:hypothetical protein n=1 Tax=Jiulongibacter sp. NS-SX5 TaxID=3463854 RepID=UPI004058395B
MRFYSTLLFLLLVSHFVSAVDFYWEGISGNFNDAGSWFDINGNKLNAIPGSTDNVFIGYRGVATVTISGGTYDVKDFNVMESTVNFTGSNSSFVYMNVYGSLELDPAAVITYLNSQTTYWEFKSTGEHLLITSGQDLEIVKMAEPGGVVNLKSNLLASRQISFFAGTLTGENLEVNCGNFFLGSTVYGPLTGEEKNLYLDNSQIICSSNSSTSPGTFFSKFQDAGTVDIQGLNYIRANKFEATGINIGNIELSEFVIDNASLNKEHIKFFDVIVNDLRILSPLESIIEGRFTVDRLIVEEEGSKVMFQSSQITNSDSLIILNTIITPAANSCNDLVYFGNTGLNRYSFYKNGGALNIQNAFVSHIHTEGSASFNISNGGVAGQNPGWNLTSKAVAKDFYWLGGAGDWNDVSHWSLDSKNYLNSDACIPGPVDNVFFTNNSFSSTGQTVDMEYSEKILVNDFNWPENNHQVIIKLTVPLGYSGMRYKPEIFGDFEIASDGEFQIDQILGAYQLRLAGDGNVNIQKNDFTPFIYLYGEYSDYDLTGDLSLDGPLVFNGGSFDSKGKAIEVGSIGASTSYKSVLNFGTSLVESHSGIRLKYSLSPNTVYADNASFTAQNFECVDCFVKRLKLLNTVNVFFNSDFGAETLELLGSGEVRFVGLPQTLTVDSLIFGDGAALDIKDELQVNKVILAPDNPSLSPLLNKAGLNPLELKSDGPLCVKGGLEFLNTTYVGDYKVHSPNAIDGGGNTDISFEPDTYSSKLFWIGKQGSFSETQNWSNIPLGCPTNSVSDISDADSLFIDQLAPIEEEDTLFVFAETQAKTLIIDEASAGTEQLELVISLHDKLKLEKLSVDEGRLTFFTDQELYDSLQTVEVKKTVEVKNSGRLNLRDVRLNMGEEVSSTSLPVCHVHDNGTFMIGYGGEFNLLGASPTGYTVLIENNGMANLFNMDMTVAPVNEALVDLKMNGVSVKSLTFDAQTEFKSDVPLQIESFFILKEGLLNEGIYQTD